MAWTQPFFLREAQTLEQWSAASARSQPRTDHRESAVAESILCQRGFVVFEGTWAFQVFVGSRGKGGDEDGGSRKRSFDGKGKGQKRTQI